MLSKNIKLIQPEDGTQPDKHGSSTPVFLIHDGGGSTYGYRCMEPLYRFVYGIPNPYFHTGGKFAGGLPEMGRLYSGWIKEMVTKKDFPARRRNLDGSLDILLGGWSLGGMLSLEIARQLTEDSQVRVIGILMIDVAYPGKNALDPVPVVPFTEASSPVVSEKNRILLRHCVEEATGMLREWQPPQWDDRLAGKRPRAILLRAKKYMPLPGGVIAGLDLKRQDKMLGWAEYDTDMFEEVVDVEGHHCSIFAQERIDGISEAVRRSLGTLERLAISKAML